MEQMARMNRSWLAMVVMAMLVASSYAGPVGGAATRESEGRRQRFPSCSIRESSAVAVSIVFAVCSGSVVLAADSVATASVSGCGDTLAAGIGVAFAQLDASSVESTIYMAFTTALSASSSTGGGTAIAEAMTLAIASAAPSIISVQDMLDGVAGAIVQVAATGKCKEAASLALTVVRTLSSVAPELVTSFRNSLQSNIATAYPPLACTFLPATPTAVGSTRFKEVTGGRGCGRVRRPLFSRDVDQKRTTSAVAVNIAMAACPTSGIASVTAMAVAIASSSSIKTTADAIAAVAGTNVDIVSLVQQVFLQSVSNKARSGIQAIGTAITVLTAEDQARLVSAVGAALKSVVEAFGCGGMEGMLPAMTAVGVDSTIMKQLCSYVSVCSGTC